MSWETVIGLEVHVQLDTRTKLFCGCPTGVGAPPNTQVCPVCLGLPGALPVPNRNAVALGVRAALALGCTVHTRSVFARKNYFYPDLPKGYQISQFDQPLATGGRLAVDSPDRGDTVIGITRLHLEEDAGKLLHDRIPGKTAIDLNRAGVPLAEIVTAPDLRSPREARAWLVGLKQLLLYAGVSDCNMEQGSLRVDANISLRPAGASALGTKAEIKNLNSFANVEHALTAEAARQRAILEAGGRPEQVTLLFDADSGRVHPVRTKEESHDYRYFADPDLPPLALSSRAIEEATAALPELPDARRARFVAQYALGSYDAAVLTAERATADYVERVIAAGAAAKSAANWIMNDPGPWPAPARLAELIGMVDRGLLSHQAGRKVLQALGADEAPLAAADRLGLLQVRDEAQLAAWVDEVLAACPAEAGRARAGEQKLLGFLTGEVMKRSRGKADPKRVQALLAQRLEAS